MNPLVQCPKCRAWLLEGLLNQPQMAPCPACGVPLRVEIFPAMFRRVNPGQTGELIMVEGESSCFYHPAKKAVRPCDGCGRFMCALCDCELDHEHYCPACLEAGRTKGKIKSLEKQRPRYDSIALALAAYPLLLFYLTLVTAPIALFIAIRYWNAPTGLVSRGKTRLVIALVLALLELSGWGFFFVYLATRHS